MDGLSYFFKQALQHKDADVRLAGVKGIGRVAEASDLPTLDAALEDEDQRVRKAAVRALATMDNKAAERRLESLLYEADETLRAVAAEAMARTRGQESASMLRELVKSDDMMARRAAIFGLAELGAKDVLVQMVREEKQWIVRSAAEVALEMLEEEETISGVEPQPQIDQAPWLISWAASRGEGLGTGEAARQTLWQVLQEGEVSARLAAAQLLTRVGRPEDVEPLQAALEDPDPDVARVAAEALEEINRRYELGVK
jgi:HEAT repeat protein